MSSSLLLLVETLLCSSLTIILTLSHKGRWFPFSFHIWSAILDFSISQCTTAFRCFCSHTFRGRHVSPLHTLTLLDGMEYTQFLVMLYSVRGLTRRRCLQRVEPLLNVVPISYGLHIFWIFSAKPLKINIAQALEVENWWIIRLSVAALRFYLPSWR